MLEFNILLVMILVIGMTLFFAILIRIQNHKLHNGSLITKLLRLAPTISAAYLFKSQQRFLNKKNKIAFKEHKSLIKFHKREINIALRKMVHRKDTAKKLEVKIDLLINNADIADFVAEQVEHHFAKKGYKVIYNKLLYKPVPDRNVVICIYYKITWEQGE